MKVMKIFHDGGGPNSGDTMDDDGYICGLNSKKEDYTKVQRRCSSWSSKSVSIRGSTYYGGTR